MDAHRIPLRKTFVRLLMVCLCTISPSLVAQEAPAPDTTPVVNAPQAAPPTNLKFEHFLVEQCFSDISNGSQRFSVDILPLSNYAR